MFIKKAVLTFLVGMLFVFPFQPVSASTNKVFYDINDCEYQSSILELYEEGVIFGTSDGKFEPDREATVYEFSAMLARAFYPDEDYSVTEDGQAWYSPYTDKLQNEGIISRYSFWNWEKGYYSAAAFIESTLIAARYYDRPLDIVNYITRMEQTAFDNGLIPENYDCSQKMLRGEVADLINKVLNKDFAKIKYVADFPVQYKLENFRGMDEFFRRHLMAIKTIPDKYIELFNRKGYTYLMAVTCEAYYPEHNYAKANVVGITDWSNKIVCMEQISDVSDIRHEFGHVISYELFKNNKGRILNFMYKHEKDSVVGFLRDYALTDPDEFFAEAFDYLLKNRDNPKTVEEFREACPLTTKIIFDNMIKCEELFNLKEINKVIQSA